jgi:hypothetical protein
MFFLVLKLKKFLDKKRIISKDAVVNINKKNNKKEELNVELKQRLKQN